MVFVKLEYETRDGKNIPTPDNYPDGIEVNVSYPSQITDEMVLDIVQYDLSTCGAEPIDVVISWTAINSEVDEKRH